MGRFSFRGTLWGTLYTTFIGTGLISASIYPVSKNKYVFFYACTYYILIFYNNNNKLIII